MCESASASDTGVTCGMATVEVSFGVALGEADVVGRMGSEMRTDKVSEVVRCFCSCKLSRIALGSFSGAVSVAVVA